ncbi:MAG: DUF1883 domain-containing protein [Acidobacteria bacterium]|nr:DUF1883 domain-containing protein [Acidobacteriota bacterium]
MKFIQTDLGHRESGEVVEVSLTGSAANVRLMDSSNFSAYKNGRRHRYRGGLVKRSPVHLRIPHAGRWYVTVDMQGLRGRTNASVRVLPRPLPEYREPPLSSIPSLVRGTTSSESGIFQDHHRQFDVFISYASEDRDDVVRPLARVLEKGGLKVWYDELALKIGDNLRRTIDQGLTNSRFGVVILSPAFFGKEWPEYELDGLVTRDIDSEDEQALLPIWHNLTKAELIEYSPSLATKLARSTATHTIEEIAAEIVEVVSSPGDSIV